MAIAEKRFSPNFHRAFEAWLGPTPSPPDAPPGPTYMPQYHQPAKVLAATLNAKATAITRPGEGGGQRRRRRPHHRLPGDDPPSPASGATPVSVPSASPSPPLARPSSSSRSSHRPPRPSRRESSEMCGTSTGLTTRSPTPRTLQLKEPQSARSAGAGGSPAVRRDAAIIVAMNLAGHWPDVPLTRLWVGGSFSLARFRGLLVDVMAVQLGRGDRKGAASGPGVQGLVDLVLAIGLVGTISRRRKRVATSATRPNGDTARRGW